MTPSELSARWELARLSSENEWLQDRVSEGRVAVKRLIVMLLLVSLALVAMIVWRAFDGGNSSDIESARIDSAVTAGKDRTTTTTTTKELNMLLPKKGEYTMVRGNRAGVFVGSVDGAEYNAIGTITVRLTNCRWLWWWEGAASLSELALLGTSKPKSCKFPAETPSQTIYDVVQTLPVTETARESIASVPVWTAHAK